MGAGYSMRAKAGGAAEIFIYEDIGASFFGGVTAKDFATDLRGLGEVATINLHINSAGGDVFDGMAIYRLLVDHKARVVSHIDGIAASIASVIAMAGNEILISEAGFVMIHNASGIAFGEAQDMRDMAELLETVSGSIADVYASRTKADRAGIVTMMDAETWFTGAEAVAGGFADSVVENLKIAARAKIDPAMHKFKHMPSALAGRPNFDAARARLSAMRLQVERNKLRAA